MDKKNWIFWGLLQDKVTIWKLREFERNDLEVLEGGKSVQVVTARGLTQVGESLKRIAVAIFMLSHWRNSGWFTLHVLMQIIRNCNVPVKCKLHTQHNLQGTSGILPWWGEIRCPCCAQQPNSRDCSGVAKGLSWRVPPALACHQAQSSRAARVCWVTGAGSSSLLWQRCGEHALLPSPWGGLRAHDAPSVAGRPHKLQTVAWAL